MLRREFLRDTFILASSLVLEPSTFFRANEIASASERVARILNDEYPWPYPVKEMESAERIVFVDKNQAVVNIFPAKGKNFDVKFYHAPEEKMLPFSQPIQFSNVKEPLDIKFNFEGPQLAYRVEYREGKEKWRSLSPKTVKTPNFNLKDKDKDKVEILIIADDHCYADLRWAHKNKDGIWKDKIVNGEYIFELVKELLKDPFYCPEEKHRKCMPFGVLLADMMAFIIRSEEPDIIINLGDTLGLETSVREREWGPEMPKKNLNLGAQMLWERLRRVWSPITPWVMYDLALGNHDGEEGYDPARPFGINWRLKLFRMPNEYSFQYKTKVPQPRFGPVGNFAISSLRGHEDYHLVKWGNDIDLIILHASGYTPNYPLTIDKWTLGAKQKEWFKRTLCSSSSLWKFVFSHNVIGGWPTSLVERIKVRPGIFTYAGTYRRGPLFSEIDYERYHDDPSMVEQTYLTELCRRNGVRAWFYGHDHVSKIKEIGKNYEGKMMIGMCCGGPRFTSNNFYKILHYERWLENYGNPDVYPPSVYTGPGIVKLTITSEQVIINYLTSARVCLSNRAVGGYSNLPPNKLPGDVIYNYRLER